MYIGYKKRYYFEYLYIQTKSYSHHKVRDTQRRRLLINRRQRDVPYNMYNINECECVCVCSLFYQILHIHTHINPPEKIRGPSDVEGVIDGVSHFFWARRRHVKKCENKNPFPLLWWCVRRRRRRFFNHTTIIYVDVCSPVGHIHTHTIYSAESVVVLHGEKAPRKKKHKK